MKKTQEKLNKFLITTKIEEITLEQIKKLFPNIDEKDEETELYLSHCLVDQKYEEDKVIKMLEILFQNGLNPNQKGYGGYTFITQALYGAEQEDETIPYPLSFFEKIIPLAKKYGYNVNSKDEDGDTLIHTAIYSEDYYGAIEPLIYLLGEEFDITAKNNAKESITDALDTSIEQAAKQKNEKWLDQLTKERNSIKKITERPEDQEILQLIERKINALNENSKDEEYLSIEKIITASKLEEKEQNQLLQKLKEKRDNQQRRKIEAKIQTLSSNFTPKKYKEAKSLIQNSILAEEDKEKNMQQINAIMDGINNQQFLEQLKKEINNIETIADIEGCLKKVLTIQEEEFREDINQRLTEESEKANKTTTKFEELYEKIRIIQSSGFEICNSIEEDLKNILVYSPKNRKIKKVDELNQKMELVIAETSKKIEELKVAEFKKLIEESNLLDETLETSIISQIIQLLHPPKENSEQGRKKGKTKVLPNQEDIYL